MSKFNKNKNNGTAPKTGASVNNNYSNKQNNHSNKQNYPTKNQSTNTQKQTKIVSYNGVDRKITLPPNGIKEGELYYCRDDVLNIKKKDPKSGHWVIVNKINSDGTCNINTITSIEESIPIVVQRDDKIEKIKKNEILPITSGSQKSTFNLWSGVNKNEIRNIDLTYIESPGNKEISQKELEIINRFIK